MLGVTLNIDASVEAETSAAGSVYISPFISFFNCAMKSGMFYSLNRL